MKQIFTILFLLQLLNTNAQVWIEQNAIWHYDYTGIGDGGFEKIEYDSDTLIDGINCQKLKFVRSSFTTNQNNELVSLGESSGLKGVTYVNGDTVFYRRNERFYVLYNFGAQIGDSWIIDTLSQNGDPFCGDTSKVEVIDVGTVTMNGTDYRYITLETIDGSPFQLSGTFVERFGPYGVGYTGHNLFPIQNFCDPNVIVDYYIHSFKCFEDNSFTLYNPSGGSCGYTIGLDENKFLGNESDKLYPNPVQNELTISIANIDNLTEIIILNVLGEIVEKYDLNSNQKSINVSNLDNGIYFIRMENGKSLKFIKN
jgi:hypothetical protein